MKLERMLSIITYLVNHQKVKARELAEKFEVSVRTIYRDIDAISQAGIPVTTFQGADGGIGIVEGYKLDKSVLTSEEILNIVAGLKGLNSISEDTRIKLLIEKLSGLANQSDYIATGNDVMIDLSPWNKNDRLGFRIKELRKAVRERKIIEFTYYNSDEKLTKRKAEPYVIVFKDTNWYLYAYCLLRKDFRLFRLSRMNDLKITDTGFNAREFSLDKVEWDEDSEEQANIVVLFDKSMEHSVNDIFGIGNYEISGDGRLIVSFQMQANSWLYGFLLGFGDKIEVLEPVKIRDRIKSIAKSIYEIYEKNEPGAGSR
ncbi:MAG: helix-turn-helix transcriptional regulator [Bacillota bacterium]